MASLDQKLVHLDLKGSPPTVKYLQELLPVLKSWGCTGLLIEYEDTFPFESDLALLVNKAAHYNQSEVRHLLHLCKELQFTVIPLVQCFGHLEYVLKHEKYFHLRECPQYPNNLCPMLDDSVDLVFSMIDQVVAMHRSCLGNGLTHLHIGSDEVYFLRRCPNCRASGQSEQDLFLNHVTRVANHVAGKHGLKPVFWDDMIRQVDPEVVKRSRLPGLAQPMVWHYASRFQLQPSYFARLASLFPSGDVWFAGSFRGSVAANCQVTPLNHHSENTQAWLKVISDFYQSEGDGGSRQRLAGFVLTGWQRFDHFACLCELLPVSLPVLAACLATLNELQFTPQIHSAVSKHLGFPDLIPWNPFVEDAPTTLNLSFPGWQVYQCVHRYQALRANFAAFLNSDLLQGWLSSRHANRLASSPAVVERLIAQSAAYHRELQQTEADFAAACSGVLLPAGIEEWLDQQVRPLVRKCDRLMASGKQIVSLCGCESAK